MFFTQHAQENKKFNTYKPPTAASTHMVFISYCKKFMSYCNV